MNGNTRNIQQPELSQRQHQILKLLQAGKVNKEVAQELGIGLGTVKQHLVAIFKKLNVSNRAMAASHGMGIFHEQESRGTSLPMADLLECRPCVVLSIALPQDASHPAVKLMYGSLAAMASANDAVFLARNGNAGDVIFGIQRVTEYDLAIALQTARAVYDDLLAMDAQIKETGPAEKLRGCLTAGVAFASMKRFGGWTGEAIASAAIASARELLNEVPPGQFVFDSTALDLIELFGIGGAQELSPTMLLRELKNLHWTGSRRIYHLVGRDAELAQLYAALTGAEKGKGKLILVEGEMGMGKSRLCDAIAKLCLKHEGRAAFCRSLPPVLGKRLYDTVSGAECSAQQVAVSLRAKPVRFPELIVIDDFHLLDKEQQALLSAAGADAIKKGKLVIFSGRRGIRENAGHPPDANTTETISLRRLSAQAIQVLVRNALGKGAIKGRASKVQRITSAASGVPLFAVELARHHEAEQLALPLRVAINARLDSLHLDHNLLREVAKNAVGANLEEVAAALGENIETLRQQMERAIAAGVLSCGADGWLSFTHPLLRRAIDNLVVE